MEMTADDKQKPWLRACVNFRAGNRLPSCGAKGAREMVAALTGGLDTRGLPWRVESVHCMGKCHLGPTMRVLPNGPYIMGAQESDVPAILELLESGRLDALAEAFPLPTDDPDA
ncbi:MAG: (2Fe-2S) ferredoxin domain-containing protein [Rickettsiales bacterium]